VAPGYVRSETSRSNQDFQNALTAEQNSGIIGEAALNTPLMGYTEPVAAGHEGQFTYQIQEPLDVAQSMLWQGSYDASFMNGEIVVIDGGVGNTTSNYSQYV
jgi:NAD(P)-dependent dehydrogenase (short-subunit alcohol dehydrogenase family)